MAPRTRAAVAAAEAPTGLVRVDRAAAAAARQCEVRKTRNEGHAWSRLRSDPDLPVDRGRERLMRKGAEPQRHVTRSHEMQ